MMFPSWQKATQQRHPVWPKKNDLKPEKIHQLAIARMPAGRWHEKASASWASRYADVSKKLYESIIFCWWFRNPVHVDMVNISLFTGVHTCEVVVWDFWTINGTPNTKWCKLYYYPMMLEAPDWKNMRKSKMASVKQIAVTIFKKNTPLSGKIIVFHRPRSL